MYKDPEKHRAKARESSRKNNAYSLTRKRKLIEKLGGRCPKCGYSKNAAALGIYLDDKPVTTMDLRSGATFNQVMRLEPTDLELVCYNCRQEERWPHCAM